MLASTILDSVSRLLGDPNPGFIWPQLQVLLPYLQEAQLATVLARPDANSVTVSELLVQGAKQNLPADGLRLLDVTRNMGTDGATAGEGVRMVDRKMLDLYNPGWTTAANASPVKAVLYDPVRAPTVYYVTPPAPNSPAAWLEIVYSATPSALPALSSSITVADVYVPALQAFVLYRAYSQQRDNPTSAGNAKENLEVFMSLLGIKSKSEMAETPIESSPINAG